MATEQLPAVAASLRGSHHRRTNTANTVNTANTATTAITTNNTSLPQSVTHAKQLLHQQQQQQQRQLHQLQQEHYEQKTHSFVLGEKQTKQKDERSFQQQYMEQQAELDRVDRHNKHINKHININNKLSNNKNSKHLSASKAAAFNTAYTANDMSNRLSIAMSKVSELLTVQPSAHDTNSRLVYTNTSESSFASMASSSLVASSRSSSEEEKKDAGDPHKQYQDHIRSHHNRRVRNNVPIPTIASTITTDTAASSSVVVDPSSAIHTDRAAKNTTTHSNDDNLFLHPMKLTEMSPMMRMRHPLSQQAVELAASSASSSNDALGNNNNTVGTKETNRSNTSNTKNSEANEDVTSSISNYYKTEEQVKVEKQRKWKRKMKLAQQQRQQEQVELAGGDGQNLIRPCSSGATNNSIGVSRTDTGSMSYDEEYDSGYDMDDDTMTMDDITMVDDASEISFSGCQPGTNLNLGEIWSSLSGIEATAVKAAKHPAQLFHKIVKSRCGVDLEEVSSSEVEDDDDGNGYSFSEDSENIHDGKSGRRGTHRRGRSPRPRSKSPQSGRHTSRESRVSTTSRQTETSVGDILDGTDDAAVHASKSKDAESVDKARRQRDEMELQRLQDQTFNLRILGKTADSVMSGGSSKTPQAGTAGTASVISGSYLLDAPGVMTSTGSLFASSVLSDSGSKRTSVSKASGLASVKSVSFDESTISKPNLGVTIPTIASLDKTDPKFIRKFVAGLNHHGIPLLWHSTPIDESSMPSNASIASTRPDSAMAYLRLESTNKNPSGIVGAGADGFTFMPSPTTAAKVPASLPTWDSPRLVWYQETISTDGFLQEELGAIDLFDIASIETDSAASPAFLQALESHPFSMPSRTVVIQLNPNANMRRPSTNNADCVAFPSSSCTTIVLEATSNDAAKTLVLGMKWMVARLAFNLIVGNMSISCELLQPEQQEPHQEQRSAIIPSCMSADEESMGPRNIRPPIIRRTKVMNDITCHLTDKAFEKSSCYEHFPVQQEERPSSGPQPLQRNTVRARNNNPPMLESERFMEDPPGAFA